jgi:hypothetical protein
MEKTFSTNALRIAVAFSLAFPLGAAHARADSPAPGKGNSNVLDFEADVIEGQTRAPDLFLQTDVKSPTQGSVLFRRKDFNDFQKVDCQRRPLIGQAARRKREQ